MAGKIALALALAFWLVVIGLGYLLFTPIEPIMHIDANPTAIIDTAKPGGIVARELVFRIRKPVTITATRRFIQLECEKRCLVVEAERTTKDYVAQQYQQTRSIMVPEYIKPGKYRIEGEVRWRENFLRDGVQDLPAWEVTIIQ